MTLTRQFSLGKITVNVHILFCLSVCALIFAESSVYALAVLLCAVLHECGHIAVIKLEGMNIEEINLLPFGAEIRMRGDAGYFAEMKIAAAGPAVNLLSGFLLYPLFLIFPNPFVLFMILCSVFLAFINLIPIRGFDGGRIVRCAAFLCLQYEKALTLIRVSELVSLILLTAFSMSVLLFSSFNISLAAICVYLFVSVYKNDC